MKESIAGTIRMASLPVPGAGAGAGAAAGAVDVVAGAGDDSARGRLPFCCVVTTWTSRFIGEWPCRSRKVGVKGEGWLLSFVLPVVAAAVAAGAPPAPAAESPLLGLLPPVASIYRTQMAWEASKEGSRQTASGQAREMRARPAVVDSK